jgi:hypothetical protein
LLRLRLYEVSHFAFSFSVVRPVPIASRALAGALLELQRANLCLGFAIPKPAPRTQGAPEGASATHHYLAPGALVSLGNSSRKLALAGREGLRAEAAISGSRFRCPSTPQPNTIGS